MASTISQATRQSVAYTEVSGKCSDAMAIASGRAAANLAVDAHSNAASVASPPKRRLRMLRCGQRLTARRPWSEANDSAVSGCEQHVRVTLPSRAQGTR